MNDCISNNKISLTVCRTGAEVISAVFEGKEKIWQNENGSWAGHSPVLFPVCGHFGVTVRGKEYPVGTHGFARKSEFTLLTKTQDCLQYCLNSDENTRKIYPYDFIFKVTYRLTETGYQTEYLVENSGKTPLYFSVGAHPSFALEKSVGTYLLQFEKDEELLHYCHDEGGYLTGETVNYGTGNLLPVPEQYLQEGRTLIFANVNSRAVTVLKGRERVAKLCFDGFPHLLIWRPQGANMLCLEPWGNLPDQRNDCTEFQSKAGLFVLGQKQEKKFSQQIFYK